MRIVRITTLVISLLSCFCARALEYGKLDALESMDYISVYSVSQDSLGAMWINCSYGLCRFNGHSLEYVHPPMPTHSIVVSRGRYIYAPSSRYIYEYDAFEGRGCVLRGPSGVNYSSCCMAVCGDSLFVGIGKEVYVQSADSLAFRADVGLRMTAMLPWRGGGVLLGAADGTISELSPDGTVRRLQSVRSKVNSMFEDSMGHIWVGLKAGGVVRFSPDMRTAVTFPIGLKEARTFTEDSNGNVYVGTVDGIAGISPSGECTVEPPSSPGGHPICSMSTDDSGRIWIGTYYDGVYYCTDNEPPFSSLDYRDEQNIRIVNDIVEDKRGDLWVMTDSYGMYRSVGERWVRIPGTEKFKTKAAYYDAETDVLYLGRYMEPILAYHIPTGRSREYAFVDPDGSGRMTAVNAIVSDGNELFVGTLDSGLWRFDPDKESVVSRRVSGDTDVIYCLTIDSGGTLWAGGNGLFRMQGERLAAFDLGINTMCMDICSDSSGVWGGTVGYGFFSVENGTVSFYNKDNCGVPDNNISVIATLGEDIVLIGNRSGVSVYNTRKQRCLNYSRLGGLKIGSTREGCVVRLSDGTYMLGGVDGIERFDGSRLDFDTLKLRLRVDRLVVNNDLKLFVADNSDDRLVLKPGWRNLSFDVASFDYDCAYSVRYEYRLEGQDDEWHEFDIDSPVQFSNMKFGNYVFSVRACIPGGGEAQVADSCSLAFRLKPEWYESPAVRMVFCLFIAGLLVLVLVVVYSKLLIAQRLKAQEEESERRTRFFIKVSHELRTPLALIIGQLELFFSKYGHSAPGSRDVEKTYAGALEMKKIISGFVEIENDDEALVAEDLPSEQDIKDIRPSLPDDGGFMPGAYTMLIVDDTPEMLSLLKSVFSSEYKILEAVNGLDALELAKTKHPDIIVSDVMMPEMDGLTLCARLRADFETCHIPVVLLTAHASEKSNLKGMLSGADDYIAKPFSVEILLARCRNLLETRKMLMDKYSIAPSTSSAPSPDTQENAQFLNAAIGAVERHLYSDDLNIATIADELSMSKSTLNNKLVQACGLSTREFIEDIRLRHSVKFLREGRRVSEVSDMLGFSSAKYFTIRFKRKYGVAPSVYLRDSAS